MKAGMMRRAGSSHILFPLVNRTETFVERTRGLLGTRGLTAEEGLLISPCNSVHTFFMRFPIDVVFLDRNNTVMHITTMLRPFRFAMALKALSVLELKAEQALITELRPGDRLVWEKLS